MLIGDDGILGRLGVDRLFMLRCAVSRSTPSRFPVARVSSSGYGSLMGRRSTTWVVDKVRVRLLDFGENGERTADTRERRGLKVRGRAGGRRARSADTDMGSSWTAITSVNVMVARPSPYILVNRFCHTSNTINIVYCAHRACAAAIARPGNVGRRAFDCYILC